MLLRRLRGLGVAVLLGASMWGLLGLTLALALLLAGRLGLLGGVAIGITPAIPGGLPGAATLAGVIVGAVNGLAFGLLVLAAERGHALERIPWWRFGLWGAAATGAAAWLTLNEVTIAAICSVLGAVASVGALALARRPTRATAPDTAATEGIPAL